MPSWKVHTFLSIIMFLSWSIFLFYVGLKFEFYYLATVLFFVVIAGVFADIDSTKSKIRELVSLVLSILVILGLFMYLKPEKWYYLPLYFILVYFFFKYLPTQHRGFTHTFSFSFFLSIGITIFLLFVFNLDFLMALLTFFILFVVYSSHIFLDRLFT